MASTGGVSSAATVASAEGQTEEGAHEAPTREAVRVDVVAMPLVEVATPEANKLQPGTIAKPQTEVAQMGRCPCRRRWSCP